MAKKADDEQVVAPVFAVEALASGISVEVNADVLTVEDAVALRAALNSALMGFVR